MFGHNSFVWTPLSASQILGADTFAAEQVANPCDADYLISSNGRRVWWRVENENGYTFESKWSFSGASQAHTFMQSAGYGNKYALVSDYEALGKPNCPPATSGRAATSWPYDNDAVIIVGYKNGTRWGYFRPKSASSRGLAGSWFNGTEAQAIAQSQATSNYVILNAGVCGTGSFPVNLTPEEILGRVEECATPSNCAVSAWSAWSACKNGSQTRTRTITNPSLNGGTPCPELTQTQTCTEPTSNGGGDSNGGDSNGGDSNGGDTDPKTCDDSNRETNADGSCASSCKAGYDFESSSADAKCVPVEEEEGSNWLLIIGGIGALVGLGYVAMNQ